MSHFEDRFHTRDGLELYESRWMPDREPRAAVVFLHGFTEHSDRYRELFETLSRRGYAVWAIDLRGHGKSQGRRVYVRSFDQYLDDLELLVARVRRSLAQQPLFLMGHSMGGAIVLLSAMERTPEVAGVVASAPPVKVGGAVFPLLRHLAWAAGRFFPRLRVVAMGSSMLSRDPDVVEAFRNDPLVYHDRFPVRTGNEVLRAGRRIRRGMDGLRTPLLILHGTGDVITNPAGSRRLFAEAASADKTQKIYEGAYHDLFHEPEKNRITAEVIQWLDARTARPTAPDTESVRGS
jgi:alpha-beta hydrolase superfamily lysophospholipase